jgi:hypothetical protein
MQNQQSPNPATADYSKFTTLLFKVMVKQPVQNGTPAGLSALQASLLRGKELAK